MLVKSEKRGLLNLLTDPSSMGMKKVNHQMKHLPWLIARVPNIFFEKGRWLWLFSHALQRGDNVEIEHTTSSLE